MSVIETRLPPAVVAPPPVLPALHNLVSSAITITEPDSRWEGGIAWRSLAGSEAGVWVPCQYDEDGEPVPADELAPKQGPRRIGPSSFQPYDVELADECSAFGLSDADWERRARLYLDAATPKAVEAEFWTATQHPDNFSLTSHTPNTDGTAPGSTGGVLNPTLVTPLEPSHALAALQQALANCGAGTRGMIHATPYLAELWGGRLQVKDIGIDDPTQPPDVSGAVSLLTTKTRGTIVVAGAGYLGTGPDGNAKATPDAGTVWAYASKMVAVRLGGVRLVPGSLAEALDRDTNSVVYRAERAAAAVPDGAPGEWQTFAVLVDLGE